MKNNYPKVSIITVNFNGKKLLRRLLNSIFSLNYPKNKLEVILIDNVSTDNSVGFVKKNYPGIKIIKNDVNNYCKAINLGIKAAKAEFVAFVNNDTRMDKNWLIELVKVIIKDEKIAAVGSKILNMAGVIQNAAHYELPNFYWGERGAGQEVKRYNTVEEVPSLCGAAVLCKKNVLLEVGLLDEDFIIYGEDVDMSLRLRQKGYRLMFVPASIIYHKIHGSATEEFSRYYIERNRLLFLAKHYPHKLSSSLLGSGYFTAEKSIDSCGKIFAIFPEVIMKLIKSHPLNITREVILELFGEITKIINYDSDILIKKFNEMAEDQRKTNLESTQLHKELQHKINELDAFRIEKEKEIFILQEEVQRYLTALQNKENEFVVYKQQKEKELSTDKDDLANLSGQLHSRMEEVFLKDNELAERRIEIDALRKELSGLAEQLANSSVNIEETKAQLQDKEKELLAYKDELNNLSGQLRQRMDEVLLKDGEIIEKDTRITSLEDELNNISHQLHQRMDEVLLKESEIIEKESQIAHLKGELDNTSAQLRQTKSELDNTSAQLRQTRDELDNTSNLLRRKIDEVCSLKVELDGIYNSEGFRFVLRPLWTVILQTRGFLKALKRKIGQIFWLVITIILTPIFLSLSLFFLLEHIAWLISKPLLKIASPKRKIKSLKDAKISLVIPNYNGIDCLRECLPSIFAAEGFTDGRNEIVVVDDGSKDESVDFIKTHFPGVRLIQNRRNKGFGFTCNRGVKAAKNDIVVLINNDIILTREFLEPLISHLQREDVFTVTPKLYGWDRKTFVWGMHMGHFQNGYIRLWNEAEMGNQDKVSQPSPSIFAIGGAMVFRRQDFLWLGGFDEIFRPNCWEDIDISYRAWKRRLKVIYEPHSLMYHKGRATLTYERPKEIKNELLFTWKNITDTTILKNHLNLLPWNLYRNRSAFLKGFFWALNYLPQTLLHRLLERRFVLEFEDKKIFNRIMLYYRNFMKRNFRHPCGDKPSVLIVSRFLPYPLNTGGKIRIHTLVKRLSDRYNFILLSLIDHEDELRYIPKLKEVFSEVYPVLAKSPLNLDLATKLFYPDMYKHAYSYSQELVDRLKEIQEAKPLDIVHIESNELLYLVDYVKHVPIVYTEHDISILSIGKSYYEKDSRFHWSFIDNLKRIFYHNRQFKKLDRIITLSKEDEYVLQKFFPEADITLIPTGVDLKHFSYDPNFRKSKKLIFVGHYRHFPNEDAIVYFTKKIFPLIRKKMPDVELLIVGSNPTAKVKKLAQNKNVVLVGEVDDVKPYLDKAAVFVNSIRISAGIKGKVLEAMACGVPVVSTKVGSSGIDARQGKEILIADNPRGFARQVIRLLNDDKLRSNLITNARRLVENKYDWLKSATKCDLIYKSLLFDNEYENINFSVTEKIIDRTKDFIEHKIEQLDGNLTNPQAGPEEIHIELTYNCNSKCIMCDLWDYNRRVPQSGRNELTLNEIKRFVEESRLLQKSRAVVLSGGEPFLRSDIVNLCGVFSKQIPDISIGILTNGVNTESIVSRTKEVLDKFQPRSLWLGSSLDGIGKEHDKIRGTDGAFLALCQTINRCKKELPGVKLSVTFTLTPYNIDQLIPAKRFADNEGIDFFAQFVVPKEAREEFIWTPKDLELAEKEIMKIIQGIIGKMGERAIFDSIDRIKDKNLISQLYYWSHLVKYQTNPQRFFKKCVSGSRFAMFNPYGDLFFCPTHKGSFIGNIREEKFDNLWMSDRAQHMRSFINNSNCHCWLVCIVFPVLEKALNNP